LIHRGLPRTRLFYRYLAPDEAFAVTSANLVQTLNLTNRTWYSPDRYRSRSDARRYLALPRTPTHRVGPFPEDELPTWSVPLRRVAPANAQPGGGWESATDDPVYLFEIAPLHE
jgi:hypothetical protein